MIFVLEAARLKSAVTSLAVFETLSVRLLTSFDVNGLVVDLVISPFSFARLKLDIAATRSG